MKLFKFLPLFALLTFVACDDETPATETTPPGSIELQFDNVFGEGADQMDLTLAAVGDTEYPFSNDMEQGFNVTFLRYFVSDIVLHNTDGNDHQIEMSADADGATGYFLIREESSASQFVGLDDVPAGDYDAVSFTIGIDSAGVLEGAAGGILDPVTNQMFWSWNAGYVAVKLEGQSPASPGRAFGNTIDTSVTGGFAYHIGGWKERTGTPLAYNNRRVRLEFFDNAKVGEDLAPHVHIEFDVKQLLGAENDIDFSRANSVHSPADTRALGLPDNMAKAFRFDHLHQ